MRPRLDLQHADLGAPMHLYVRPQTDAGRLAMIGECLQVLIEDVLVEDEIWRRQVVLRNT